MAEITGSNLEDPALNQVEQVTLIADHLWALCPLVNGAEDYTPTPPVAPVNGQLWLIGAAATGIWTGKAQQVAIYIAGAFHYLDAPQEGWMVWVKDVNWYYRYDGSVWIALIAHGTLTLDNGGGTTTTVNDAAVTANSRITLMASSANAAAAVGSAAGVYISAKVAGTSFTVTHPASPGASATMDYVIFN